MQDSQHAHNCKIETDIIVFNVLMIVDWADSIDWSNTQWFDSLIIKS